ncbi:hypothetical protein ES708_29702 [subsurface metagenome]
MTWEILWVVVSFLLVPALVLPSCGPAAPKEITPVHFSKVTIDGPFWAQRMRINRERTIPYEYKVCKETGRIDSLKLGWEPGKEPVPHLFWDSDIAKWIEAASYSLTTHPDSQLDSLIDGLVELITKAQQPFITKLGCHISHAGVKVHCPNGVAHRFVLLADRLV